MIKDRPNKFIKWFTAKIVVRWLLSHFASLKFIGELTVAHDRSCLMLMNHHSANDGGILHRICRKILKKEFKAMVIESQLKAFPFLKYAGCFPVNKKSRKMIESLNYAAELLQDPTVMLGIYPQGGFYSMHLNTIHFVSGLEYIFKRTHTIPFQVFFGVTLLDYLESFKPVARVYLTEYHGERQANQMEEAYNQFYIECKQQQQRLYNPPERVIDKIG
ncbi:MAG: 1-acyl-sn-glycerol-3-phosphate acyltransferase [Bacteroidota bacterium]